MYEVFDRFLRKDTWQKDHPSDRRQFFLLLEKVVDNEGFSPDSMAEHMMQKLGVLPGQIDDHRVGAVRRLAVDAWAVKDFLAATGR